MKEVVKSPTCLFFGFCFNFVLESLDAGQERSRWGDMSALARAVVKAASLEMELGTSFGTIEAWHANPLIRLQGSCCEVEVPEGDSALGGLICVGDPSLVPV